MIPVFNTIAAILTIGFGAFGFLAPRFTLGALDLQTTASTMGLSEMRASVGGLFVFFGVYGLIFPTREVFFFLGIAYAGAAAGRALSLILDRPPIAKVSVFGGIELILAALLIALNSTPQTSV